MVEVENEKYKNLKLFISNKKKECMEYYTVSKMLGYNIIIDQSDNDNLLLVRTKEKINESLEEILLKDVTMIITDYCIP